MRPGRLLFTAGVVGLLAAIVVASHRHPAAAPSPPPPAAPASNAGGVAWLALPAGVVVIVCVIGTVLAYRRSRPTTRRPPARVYGHWHVILNAQPVAGGPWVVVRRGYRGQVASSRAEVAAAVEAEARAINPGLRYRADVVEAQPQTVRT